jgi:hypothetical protein
MTALIEHSRLIASPQEVEAVWLSTVYSMFPVISFPLTFCAAVNGWRNHRTRGCFIPKDLVKWFGTALALMVKVFPIFPVQK